MRLPLSARGKGRYWDARMTTSIRLAALTLLALAGTAGAAPPAPAAAASGTTVSRGADYVSPPAAPERFYLDARTRPLAPVWKPGDPIREIPRQFHGEEERQRNPPAPVNPVTQNIDVLVQLQRAFQPRGGGGFTTPLVNADGPGFSGFFPPDPSGDVGGGVYVEVINGTAGDASYTIHDATSGDLLAGPFNMQGLGSGGPCANGGGDGVVVFDQLAQRWLFTEFPSNGNDLCVYLSADANPVSTTWTRYVFATPSFPDYPKYGVWPDAYYAGANEGPAVYALDRNRMLAGQTATLQRKSVPGLNGLGFQMLPPASLFGSTPPPAGAPGIFIRDNDDERNNPGSNDPDHDFLELFTLSVDFTTPANTALSGPVQVAEDEFNSKFTITDGGFGAIHQPGTSQTLDPLLEVPMVPVHYRNFGTYEVLVGNHVTRLDTTGSNNLAGIRWFELRRTGGPSNPWQLYQQGTYAPNDADGQISRWMGAIGMDESGNIALGYSVARSTPAVNPGLRYVGREASDPLGVMTTTETTLVDGASSQTSADRWGDYFGMGVDPDDGCTFWFTGMYMPSGGQWRTRYASFRFDSCGTPTFTTTGDGLSQGVCAASASAVALNPVTITVNSRNGFTDPVDMSFELGLPAGFSGSYSVTPVNPPGTTVANLSVDGTAVPGPHAITLRGTSGSTTRDLELDVNVSTAIAGAATLTAPADGATNVASQPLFTWTAGDQAATYLIEIATDAAFDDVILSQTVTTASFQPTAALPLNTQLWWRVTATNDCGATPSAAASFVTLPAPGQCSLGTPTQTLFNDDVESGTGTWTHDAATGTDSWAISTTRASSPTHAWKAADPATVADQRLTSQVFTLPSELSGLTLQFEHFPILDISGTSCRDGGILEVALDGGTFSQVPNTQLLVGSYTGPVSTGTGNPLAGNQAWCGTTTGSFRPVVVDLSTYAGHDVQFRFRLGSNNSISREGWYIDDISVQGCGVTTPDDTIFKDGFDGTAP